MPDPATILEGLGSIADRALPVAAVWHARLGVRLDAALVVGALFVLALRTSSRRLESSPSKMRVFNQQLLDREASGAKKRAPSIGAKAAA